MSNTTISINEVTYSALQNVKHKLERHHKHNISFDATVLYLLEVEKLYGTVQRSTSI